MNSELFVQIEKLKRRMRSKVFSRSFCWVMWEENYVYSMENIEGVFAAYLEKVKKITGENQVGNELFLQFRDEMAAMIYEAAIQRNEFKWAMHFQNKYRS